MYAKTFATTAIALIGAFVSIAPAFAGEAEPNHPVAYTSTVSRADVLAAALQARAAGLIATGEQTSVIFDAPPTGLTRAQVHAEAVEANRLGLLGRGELDVAPTAAQLERIRMAGLRAISMTVASR